MQNQGVGAEGPQQSPAMASRETKYARCKMEAFERNMCRKIWSQSDEN